MFNYKNILKTIAESQGYCLGLEAHHLNQGDLTAAKRYTKLAQDFSRQLLKIKNRALIYSNVSRQQCLEIEYQGIKNGKIQASFNLTGETYAE